LISSPPTIDLDAHLHRFGPLGSGAHTTAEALIRAVEEAGLRGRGGAGFPTAVKMTAVARATQRRSIGGRRVPFVVANGTEGEPISIKDVTLLSFAPHLVLDGIVAAAAAVGADEAVLCVDRGRPRVLGALEHALAERARVGLDPIPIQLAAPPSHYVTGEESALTHWLNSGDAVPTAVPPRPFERGVAGRPTLIDNVETLANVALIARYGAPWWRSVGTAGDPGSALVTVTDGVHVPRVFEVPYGLPLDSLLTHAGVGATSAVLIGGYFGVWLRPDVAASLALAPSELARVGASMGCGAIVALPRSVCPLVEVARVTRWLAGESAGQCGPCVHGLPAIAGAVEGLVVGDRSRVAERQLQRWLPMVEGRGACKLPDGAVRFVRSALNVFAAHADEHRRGRCPLVDAPAVLPVPVHRGGWR
jgi:NADH:ubiquinone oxidoreductase subunit F (NADH-binding)